MVIFCVNLPAYRQLKKLKKEILQKAEEALSAFRTSLGCDAIFCDDGNWVFGKSITGSEGNLKRIKHEIAKTLIDFRDGMRAYERRLQGYCLLVDVYDTALNRAVLEEMRKSMLAGENDDELLITERGAKLFDGILEYRRTDGKIYAISGILPQNELGEKTSADFMVRETLLREFLDIFESCYLAESAVQTIVLLARPGDGGIETVRHALQAKFSAIDAAWITTRAGYTRFGDAAPVVCSVSETGDICSVPDHLREYERIIWERQLAIIEKAAGADGHCLASDFPAVDTFQLVDLLIAAYTRWMEGYLLPPVWVLENYEQLSPFVEDACIRIVNNNASGNLITVFVVNGEDVPEELRPLPHIVLRVPALEESEIEAKVSAAAASQERQPPQNPGETPGQIMSICNGSMKSLYRLLYLTGSQKLLAREEFQPLCSRLSDLDPAIQKTLYFVFEGVRVLKKEQLFGFLVKIGVPEENIRLALRICLEMKLDIDSDLWEIKPALACLDRLLDIPRKSIVGSLVRFVSEEFERTGILPGPAAIEMLNGAKRPELGLKPVARYVTCLLVSGNVSSARNVIENAEYLFSSPASSVVINILNLRTATLGKDTRRASAALSKLRAFDDTGDNAIEGQRYLEYARYHYAAEAFQEGLQDSKNALIHFQQRDNPEENEAYFYIGIHMLAQSKIDEAAAYLQIARESTPREDEALFMLNGVYSAVTQFMAGNLTKALAALEESKLKSAESALHTYQMYLVFLEVRIQFELGHYEKCIRLCSDGLNLCILYEIEPEPVFRKWLWRSEAFYGNTAEAVKALEQLPLDMEQQLFLAEALFLSERGEKALQVLQSVSVGGDGNTGHFKPAEQMQWGTGFSQLEDRVLSSSADGGVLSTQVRAFSSFLQSIYQKDESGINELGRITREEKLSNIDPNNGLYYYLYSCAIGRGAGQNNLDRLTALSKAFKYIQERAATMGNSSDKQSYLRKNYFNSKILEDAQNSNLM